MFKHLLKEITVACMASLTFICASFSVYAKEDDVNTLKEQNSILESENADLQSRIEQLESENASLQEIIEENTITEESEENKTEDEDLIIDVGDTELVQEKWKESDDYGSPYPGWEIEMLHEIYDENAATYKMNYIGKTYAISGAVNGIHEDYVNLIVREKDGSFKTTGGAWVWAYLPIEELATLSVGDEITVVGEFAEDDTDYGSPSVHGPFTVIKDARIYEPDIVQ